MSLPRPPALPDHDRRNSLNTIHTLPCPLYEVNFTISLRQKVTKFFRDDDPARGYIISSIFFVCGIVTFLQTLIGCRLPIIQGGTFTFVTPTLAILALDKWSRQCPPLEDDEAWAQIDEETRQEMWQVASLMGLEWWLGCLIQQSLLGENQRGAGRHLCCLDISAGGWLHWPAGRPPQVHHSSHHRALGSHDRPQPLRRGLTECLQTLGCRCWVGTQRIESLMIIFSFLAPSF